MTGAFLTRSVPALVYLFLATGTVSAYEHVESWFVLPLTTLVVLMAVASFLDREVLNLRNLAAVGAFILPFAVYYLLMGARSEDGVLLARRIEGAIIITFLVALLTLSSFLRSGEASFFANFVGFAVVILGLTLVYKWHFGFDDRDVRFFLNGPIVFSWLMCYAALLTVHFVATRQFPIAAGLLLPVFAAAALWSASKGPLLALALTLAKVLFDHRRTGGFFAAVLLLVPAGAMLLWVVPNEISERLGALIRLYSSELEPSDYGSVGVRMDMWMSSVSMFLHNLVVGVGPANWQFHSAEGELLYPHNLFLEIGAETGIVGLVLLLGTLAFVWVKTSYVGRLSMIFFLICSSFSGDVSYLRMIVAIPIAAAVYAAMARRESLHHDTLRDGQPA